MKKSYLFGDNESVVDSGSIPTDRLNKRHNFLSYHRVRGAIAAGFINFHHLNGKYNPANILSNTGGTPGNLATTSTVDAFCRGHLQAPGSWIL